MMYIGKLNDKMPVRSVELVGEGGKILTGGNPFTGESLRLFWRDITPSGLTMGITFTEGIWLDSMVLHFPGVTPLSVSLCDEEGRVLDRYAGETGKPITEKQIVLRLCDTATRLQLHMETNLSDIHISQIELWGAVASAEPILYPTPQKAVYGDARYPVTRYTTLWAEDEEGMKVLPILQEKFTACTGVSLTIAENGKITLYREEGIAEGGYRLCITEEHIAMYAAGLRGFVQGVETLCKLTEKGSVPACTLEDAPFCPFRGVHLYLPAPDQMDFARRLVKNLLSPMGYNTIILEIAGAMRFHSRPEINEAFLEANRKAEAGVWPSFPHGDVGGRQIVEQEDVRAFCEYVRRFGIDVVPEVQSLSHVQFMTQAYPEIGERPAGETAYEKTDERFTDVPPDRFYAHCYCPSQPKSYEILFDLLDEIVEVCRPTKYVHIGHDEVYQIGVCPVCSQRDPAELFREDVCRIYEHLRQKGLKAMMWSDMLQPVSGYKTPNARFDLPKDIVMLDFIWYFHLGKDIEENLLSEGYPVAVGNLYSSNFPRYESRIRRPGMLGGEVSAWVSTDENCLAREGKLYDILYTAQMLWSDTYSEYTRYAYDRILAPKLPYLRESLRGSRIPSLHTHRETVLWENGCTDMPTGCFDSLLIEHTAGKKHHREPWVPFAVIGTYIVTFADGRDISIPVTYGGNIGYSGRRAHQPLLHHLFRHNGYITAWECDCLERRDETGGIQTVYRLEWCNPRPQTAITAIRYEGDDDVLCSRITGITSTKE